MLGQLERLRGTQMTCPVCKTKDARRSRRQFAGDYFLSGVGVLPWRCRKCETRFYARLMPLNEALHAHCPLCGNPELKRISGEYVNSPLSLLWRFLHLPAYRCEPCRHKYFSIKPYRHRNAEAGQLSSAD